MQSRMQSLINFIYLTFLHCGFSNVSSKHMQETIKRHIDCIYLTFLHCQHNTVSFRGSPPHQQGLKSLLAGVWASEDLPWLTPPPTGLKIPVGAGVSAGALAQGFRRSPTRQQGNTPVRGVALVHGVQIPISLEYQISPPATHIWYSSNWNAPDWWCHNFSEPLSWLQNKITIHPKQVGFIFAYFSM